MWRSSFLELSVQISCRPRALVGCLLAACAVAAQAQVLAYSNQATSLSAQFSNAGTVSQGGIQTTRLIADLIQTNQVGGALTITHLSLVTYSAAVTPFQAQANFVVYAADGPSGGPGSFLRALGWAPQTYGGGNVTVGGTLSTPFVVPGTTGSFWVGVYFTDDRSGLPGGGVTGATQAQMNSLGTMMYGPPVVGSSGPSLFSGTAGSAVITSNPAGGIVNYSVPNGNMSWRVEVATAVPEASTALMALLGLPALGLVVVRRRKLAAA